MFKKNLNEEVINSMSQIERAKYSFTVENRYSSLVSDHSCILQGQFVRHAFCLCY